MIATVAAPTGPAVLDLLPRLAAALNGSGPALRPVADAATPPPVQDVPGLALVVPTSGSTGAPKQVLLTADALRHSAVAGQHRLGGDADPGHWLLALPVHHIAGLNVLLRAVVAGRAPVVLDIARPFTVDAFAGATGRLPSGPAFVSLVPTQLHRLLAEPDGVAALLRYTAVLVGGAATAPLQLDAARDAGVRLVTSYGMSETSGGSVYDGKPLDGVDVGLDADGRIVLTGPVVAHGYAGQAPFAGRFITSDLGRMVNGRLAVLGRADDVLLSGGVNVAPQAVEDLVAGLPGVGEVVVTGVPDDEWGTRVVAVVVPSGGSPRLADLRARVTAVLGAAAAPKDLVLTDSLPRLPLGKVDRAAAARIARAALPG